MPLGAINGCASVCVCMPLNANKFCGLPYEFVSFGLEAERSVVVKGKKNTKRATIKETKAVRQVSTDLQHNEEWGRRVF